MRRFHVDVKISAVGSERVVHETSYCADDHSVHRLLFAIDPLVAAYFAEAERLSHTPNPQKQRKEPHP